jgi:hypothetical protein
MGKVGKPLHQLAVRNFRRVMRPALDKAEHFVRSVALDVEFDRSKFRHERHRECLSAEASLEIVREYAVQRQISWIGDVGGDDQH